MTQQTANSISNIVTDIHFNIIFSRIVVSQDVLPNTMAVRSISEALRVYYSPLGHKLTLRLTLFLVRHLRETASDKFNSAHGRLASLSSVRNN